jgi:UPF0755 protein
MVHRFRQVAAQLHLAAGSPQDIARTVTLASLVEKEVSQDSERPSSPASSPTASPRNMPLATDPSVIYAALLEGRYRGTIYASDLQSPSPYNTYRHTGLPPGPICNPGVAALKAALAPPTPTTSTSSPTPQGHSRFSATLKEHAEQVQTTAAPCVSQPRPLNPCLGAHPEN